MSEIFFFLFEMESHYIGQADPKCLDSSNREEQLVLQTGVTIA